MTATAEIGAAQREERFKDIANRIADVVARELVNADKIGPRDASAAILAATREFKGVLPEEMIINVATAAVDRERVRRQEIADYRAWAAKQPKPRRRWR